MRDKQVLRGDVREVMDRWKKGGEEGAVLGDGEQGGMMQTL